MAGYPNSDRKNPVPLPSMPPGADDPTAAPMDSTEESTKVGGEEMLNRIKEWHRQARDHSADWRRESEVWYGLVAGDQWDENDVAVLKQQKRPPVTFNRVAPVVDSVAGMEIGNRQEVQYLPRTQGDVRPNEIFNEAAKWVRDECQAESEESDAFHDTIVCGMGATETRPDYEEDPEGLIKIDRIDPLEMFWDPTAKKRNLTDRRYHMRVLTMPIEDAEAMFPEFTASDLDAQWARISVPELHPHDATEAPFYRNDQSGRDDQGRSRKLATLVYAEWWVREPYHRVVNPATNEKMDVSAENFPRLRERTAKLGIEIKAQKLTRRRYMQGFFGARTLSITDGRCKCGFSINFMTGKRDRNKNTWYGLVRAMKDPQQWANKFFSQILYIINANAKGGLIIEEGAVANLRRFQDTWADPSGITIVRKGALKSGAIQPKTAITYPTGLDKLMEFTISSIRDVTGVNLEMIGLADRDQPGVLEAQRKEAGMTILAGLFDAHRHYVQEQGKVLLYMIQEYIAPGRLIRVTGEQGDIKYMQLVKDPQTVEYDVIVSEAPSSPNQKQRTWGMIMQLGPLLMKAPLPPQVWAELIKYSPLPESLAQSIANAITQPQQPNPMIQVETELKAAQTENYRAQAVKNLADAGVTQAGPQMQMAQLLADVIGQHGDQQHEAAMMAGEQHGDMQAQLLGHIADMAGQAGQHATATAQQQADQAHAAGTQAADQAHQAEQADLDRAHQAQLAEQAAQVAAERGAARMQ